MAVCEHENLKHFLEARETRPRDVNIQFDLARRDGWCPVGHPPNMPCPRPDLPDFHVPLALDTVPDIPTYLDTEVIVLESLLSDNVMRVIILKTGSDHEMLCKVATTEMTAAAIFRELRCLIILATVNSATTGRRTTPLARIPKLLGIVRSSDHGGVIGLVETFVPHAHAEESSKEEEDKKGRKTLQTLYYMDLTKIDVSRREKWICEIHETIAALY